MKVLVCGGRDFNDYSFVKKSLDLGKDKITQIIHGGARGADTLAGKWAQENNIDCKVFMADWDKHGKSAGYKRNSQMLNEGKPDIVIAFNGGKGTAMMVKIAKEANVRVWQPKCLKSALTP